MKQSPILLEIRPGYAAIWLDFGVLLLILNLPNNNAVLIFGESMSTGSLKRKLSAILYADVAGYSRLTGGDEETKKGTDLFSNYNLNQPAIIYWKIDLSPFSSTTTFYSSSLLP
jgi:hypothetical protein